ncbi:MAG: polysaccharide deacetylase family protein [Thermoleophilia bacterium]
MTEPMRKNQTIAAAATTGAAAAGAAALLWRADHRGPAAAIAATAAWCIGGAFAANTPLLGPLRRRGPAGGDAAALTFDDGPGPSTSDVLDALAQEGVRATFFVLGRQARTHPELVARMHREGHQVASHGDDHGILVFRGPGYVAGQLRRTERAVADAAGPDALSRLFRAPHGFRGPATWPTVRAMGYRMAGWTAGVWDSAEPGTQVIVERCRSALTPGAVILLHDADGWAPGKGRDQTAQAIPGICAAARDAGLRLVRMDQLVPAA